MQKLKKDLVAIKEFDEAIKINPSYKKAYYLKGISL